MRIIDYISELRVELLHNDKMDNKYNDNRFLYELINTQRNTWLKNEMNKGRSIEDNIRQSINGLELQVADASTFPLIATNSRVLRTIDKIPRTIERLHNDTILQVRNSNLVSQKYNYVHRDKFPFVGNGRFNKSDIFITLYNDHLYVKLQKENPKIAMLTHLTIEGVFEDPREPYYFKDEARKATYDVYLEEYPLSRAMWTYIKGVILQAEGKLITNIPASNTINNSDLQ